MSHKLLIFIDARTLDNTPASTAHSLLSTIFSGCIHVSILFIEPTYPESIYRMQPKKLLIMNGSILDKYLGPRI